MEGMEPAWNQETLRRGLGEEKDPVGEGRAVGRRWGGDGKGTGRGKWAGPQHGGTRSPGLGQAELVISFETAQ